jgi:hypothetical protein
MNIVRNEKELTWVPIIGRKDRSTLRRRRPGRLGTELCQWSCHRTACITRLVLEGMSILMPRISSSATFFYKRVFPIIWFGFLLIFVAISLFSGSRSGAFPPVPFLIMPALMMVIGYVIMKKLVFDLVDEVLDAGDALLIRNGSQQGQVPLSEIMNVSYSQLVNPPRVTLSLRNPGAFGAKVTFCAPLRFMPFSTSPVIDKLIERIDAARSRR